MNQRKFTRTIVATLIAGLMGTPILGTVTGTVAAAQAVQNTTSNYLYDPAGNLTQITDPLGRITNNGYDALQRIKSQTAPVPAPGVARPVTRFTYDGLDQLASVTDPRTLLTAYSVDGFGQTLSQSSPDTGATSKTHDAAGNLATVTDARGKTTTFTYDVLGRVTQTTYATGTPTLFEYDGGSGGVTTDIGHLTRMTDESGETIFTYNAFGQILSKAQSTVGGNGATATLTMTYTYGSQGTSTGKVESITYPSGNRINYGYDTAGRIHSLILNPRTLGGGTNSSVAIVILNNVAYSPFGAPLSWTWGNHSPSQPNVSVRVFDVDGRLSGYPLGAVAAGGVYRTIAYDAANRVKTFTHAGSGTASSLNQTFNYDDLDRITSYTSATASLGYGYDQNGNRNQYRIGASTYTNSIATNNNRLAGSNGPLPPTGYSYDLAGNVLNAGSITFEYGDRGRIVSSIKDGVTTNYLYNGAGQRTLKTGTATTGGAISFAYDEEGHTVGEYAPALGTFQETVFFGDTPVAAMSDGNVYNVYSDHLNTPRLITNSVDNTIVWRWDSADPFGVSAPIETLSTIGDPFRYNLRFPGQVFDAETGLHYNYFRDYDPQTGRYVQSDPIGLEGGVNTYTYVGGRPVTAVDPYGLKEYSDGFMGPLPRSGYRTAEMTRTICGNVPPFPPGVDYADNMDRARHNPFWFRDQVKNKGPMDYKQRGSVYQDFGNFNYGAVGAAVGFPNSILLREAGRAQKAAGTSRPNWGDPGSRANPIGGTPPYGDDPEDQAWIQRGVDFCKCMRSQ
jgi:RHS repeat-associated protein